MKRAVVEDVNGNYKSAVKLYCESLEHFVPAIHCKLTIYFSPSKYIIYSVPSPDSSLFYRETHLPSNMIWYDMIDNKWVHLCRSKCRKFRNVSCYSWNYFKCWSMLVMLFNHNWIYWSYLLNDRIGFSITNVLQMEC